MSVNLHAQRIGREYGYGYHDPRRAVNLLVGWNVANREDAERMVEEWAKEGVESLLDCARDEVEEARASV